MKKLIPILFTFLITVFTIPTHAAWQITAETQVIDDKVIITGNVNSETIQQITLLVKDSKERIVYINQFSSDSKGNFTHGFMVADFAEEGIFNVYIGGDNVEPVYTGSFSYIPRKNYVQNCFGNINATLNIISYNMTLSGTAECELGNKFLLEVKNASTNEILLSKEIRNKDGECEFELSLPNILNEKEYVFSLNAIDSVKNESVATLTANITTGATLTVDGAFEFSNTSCADLDFTSNHTSILSKSSKISGRGTLNKSLPNVFVLASFGIDASFYDEKPQKIIGRNGQAIELTDDIPQHFDIYINQKASFDNLKNQFFIIYDDNKLKMIDTNAKTFSGGTFFNSINSANLELQCDSDGVSEFIVNYPHLIGTNFNSNLGIIRFQRLTLEPVEILIKY